MSGYSENVTIDEGVDAYGTRTQLHFEGDSLIVQKTFDPTDILERCHALRTETAGQRWGEMRKVAEVPMEVYLQASLIKENAERKKFLRNYLRQNTHFIAFDRYLK